MTRNQMFTAADMELEYPMSLGVYDHYAKAQRAVDYLADQGFPVQNVEIVGTELRSIERVTGRLTRGKIAAAGVLSGLWIGLFVGIAFSLFSDRNQFAFLITTPLLGAAFGLVWSQFGYSAATRQAAAISPRSTRSSLPSTKCSWSTSTPLAHMDCSHPCRWSRPPDSALSPARRSAGDHCRGCSVIVESTFR